MASQPAAVPCAGKLGAIGEAAGERPKLVFFHSKLDGRCRRVEGYIAQVLQRRKNHATFIRRDIDIDERPDLAARLRIETVPTLLVVADRRVQTRLVPPRGCKDIEATLRPWLH